MSVVVITGGAAGLGRAIAAKLISRGAAAAIIDRDATLCEAVAEETGASWAVADVTDPEQMRRAIDGLADKHDGLSGLVNSAGITRTGPSESFSTADWKMVIDVDLSGTFYACQAAYRHLRPGSGIVNIASIAATRVMPGRAAYTSAKAAVVGLTKSLAVEWAASNIRVNAIGPAWADTALFRGLIDRGVVDLQGITDKIPAGRLCSEDDVANTALYLLDSEAASFVTGQTIYVDGGYLWAG